MFSDSIRKIMDATIHGGDNLTIIKFISNYIMDIISLFFPVIAIIIIAATGFRLMRSSSMKQQMKDELIYTASILFTLFLLMNVKVETSTSSITSDKSYAVVELYSRLLSLGEDLADDLTYKLLYGSFATNHENPAKESDRLHTVFERQTLNNPIAYSVGIMNNFQNIQNRILAGENILFSMPNNLTPYRRLVIYDFFINRNDTAVGYYTKSRLISDYSRDITIDSIWYGSPFIGTRYYFNLVSLNRRRDKSGPTIPEILFSLNKANRIDTPGLMSYRLYPIHIYGRLIISEFYNIFNDMKRRTIRYINYLHLDKRDRNGKYLFPKAMDAYHLLDSITKILSYAARESNYKQFITKTDRVIMNYKGDYKDYLIKIKEDVEYIRAKSEKITKEAMSDKTTATASSLNNYVKRYRDLFNIGRMNITKDLYDIVYLNNSILTKVSVLPTRILMYLDNATSSSAVGLSSGSNLNSIINSNLNSAIESFKKELITKKNLHINIQESSESLSSLLRAVSGDSNESREIHWSDLGRYFAALKNRYAADVLFNINSIIDIGYQSMYRLTAVEAKNKAEKAYKIRQAIGENSVQDRIDNIRDVVVSIAGASAALAALGDQISITNMIIALFNSIAAIIKIVASVAIKSLYTTTIAFLVISVILNLVYILIPSFLWTLAIIAWYIKTAIMLALFPLNFLLLAVRGRIRAVETLIWNFLGQALVPIAMVAIFFIVIVFSTVLEESIISLLPMSGLKIFGIQGDTSIYVLDIINDKVSYLINDIIIIVLSIIVNAQLYMQFFKADDFISEIIGERVSFGNTLNAQEILNKSKLGSYI